MAAIRRKLHDYLEVADDKKIKAIYTLVEQEVEEGIEEYTEAFKAELDRRYEEHKKGAGTISREAMDSRIKKTLAK
jgi:putative addiction module component (TIGR02574 family)